MSGDLVERVARAMCKVSTFKDDCEVRRWMGPAEEAIRVVVEECAKTIEALEPMFAQQSMRDIERAAITDAANHIRALAKGDGE